MTDHQPVVDGMSELSLGHSSSEKGEKPAAAAATEESSATTTTPSVNALVDPSTEPTLPAPSSVPAANGISQSVAEVYKPEQSDGSTSVVDASPTEPLGNDQSQSLDPKLHAIAAIKCRDFAASPPPARPAPTVTGQALSTGVSANGMKGLASAPAVQTLASTKTSSSSSSSQDMAQSTSAPESGTSTPTTQQQQRPTPTTRPSQLGAGGGGGVRRPGQGGSAGLATRIPPSLQAKMAAVRFSPTSITDLLTPS
jgi:hypothetical protein